jgi:nucleoside 2-deoxyribosyltransferase
LRDFLVYLAGPITGLTYDQGQDWREYVAQALPKEFQAISPLRAKDVRLARVGIIEDTYEDDPLTTAKGITTRDRMDCTRSDLIIMNLLGATRVSIGTMIEIGWANANNIPIILIMEKGNLHNHAMVRECAGWTVDNLEHAITIAAATLPDGKGTARELPVHPNAFRVSYEERAPVLPTLDEIAARSYRVPVLDQAAA